MSEPKAPAEPAVPPVDAAVAAPTGPAETEDAFAPPGTADRAGRPLRDLAKGLVFIGVLVGAAVLARMETLPFSDAPNPLRRLTDKEQAAELRTELRAGVWGPAIFIAAYVVTCILFLPTIVMSILGGAAFGLWPGILYIWLGAVGGAVATFFLSRLLGRDAVRRLAGPWLTWLDTRAERHGFVLILYSRLLGLPFPPVNYASGVAAVRLRDFVLGTSLGIIPFTGLLTWFGESLVEGAGWETYLRLGGAGLAIAFLSGLPLAIRYHVNRRRARQAAAARSDAASAPSPEAQARTARVDNPGDSP